jgi:polysaccharide export outer membrane protein
MATLQRPVAPSQLLLTIKCVNPPSTWVFTVRIRMSLRRVLVFCGVALALAGCARPRYATEPLARSELDMRMYGAPQPASYAVRRVAQVVPVAAAFDDGPYTLDSGDKLRIVVFGQDPLSNNYTVDARGAVSLPLIGTVEARGMTTAQLGNAIATRLKASFIRDPSVAVEIEIYRPFFVLGEVTYPGQYPYVPNTTVENAIAIAGGFTPRAFRRTVTITRKLQGLPARSALPLRAPLRPGDTIDVGERWF